MVAGKEETETMTAHLEQLIRKLVPVLLQELRSLVGDRPGVVRNHKGRITELGFGEVRVLVVVLGKLDQHARVCPLGEPALFVQQSEEAQFLCVRVCAYVWVDWCACVPVCLCAIVCESCDEERNHYDISLG